MNVGEIQSQIQLADSFLQQKLDDQAQATFEKILTYNLAEASALAYFRLGEIYNRKNDVFLSEKYHRLAFTTNAALCGQLLPAEISHRNYLYHVPEQIEIKTCPICSSGAKDHSVYNIAVSANFIDGFDPIRVWRQCNNLDCSHIFASLIPKNLTHILSKTDSSVIQEPKIHRLAQIGQVLSTLTQDVDIKTCLEIGAGAGEQVAVALEFGLDVSAVEIRDSYCANLKKTFDINVYNQSIEDMEFQDSYDLVLMGDVLEHVIDPISLLKNLKKLISCNGKLWISTPNFESAMSRLCKTQDPMWQVCEHLQYFSKKSICYAFDQMGFKLVEYKSSFQYNGSMELTVK
ncbi:MAG: class I SAM-dependent methyltransferase [Candidatus Cloacimonetes bacterium]|nr:class I SAM-dependent methyltransferase [Candidatus Cloacimonadota bacterium]